MNSDRPKGDAAPLAAITTGAPVPTTEAQAKELTPPAAPGEWRLVEDSGIVHVTNGVFVFPASNRVSGQVLLGLLNSLNRADAMDDAVKFAIAMLDRDMPPSNIVAVRERLLAAALHK